MKIVKESLFEKFVEDSDPIEDMGIGILAQIDKFIRENDEEKYVEGALQSRAEFLAQNRNKSLNPQLKLWIEFLLRQGLEDPSHWSEDYIDDMMKLDINFAENLTEFPDDIFDFTKNDNGNYTLIAHDWSNFVLVFNFNSRNSISEKFLRLLFKFDATYYFEYNYDLYDIFNELDDEQKDILFKYLNETFPEIKSKNAKSIEELFEEIDHTPIGKLLEKAWSSYMAFCTENETWKDVTNTIKDHFDIIYEDKTSTDFKFIITEEGLNKLFAAYMAPDDFGIYYDANKNYVSIEHDIELFLEEIDAHI